MTRSKYLYAALLATIGLAVAAPAASADHHLERINEVFLATGDGDAEKQFVEFHDLGGAEPYPGSDYTLDAYDGAGNHLGAYSLSAHATGAQFNDWTVMTTGASGVFPGMADRVEQNGFPPDSSHLGMSGDGTGQICFQKAAEKTVCLSWGNVTNQVLGVYDSDLVTAPPNGQSISRQSNGCFQFASPTPKNPTNASGAAAGPCSSSGGGGGGGGGGSGPPAASVAPNAALSGKGSQKLGSSVSVTVQCPNAPCLASATGTISVPKLSKTFKIKADDVQIAQGGEATLKLKISSKARKAIKKALKKGKKIKAKIIVTAKNTAGTTSAKKTIKLKR